MSARSPASLYDCRSGISEPTPRTDTCSMRAASEPLRRTQTCSNRAGCGRITRRWTVLCDRRIPAAEGQTACHRIVQGVSSWRQRDRRADYQSHWHGGASRWLTLRGLRDAARQRWVDRCLFLDEASQGDDDELNELRRCGKWGAVRPDLRRFARLLQRGRYGRQARRQQVGDSRDGKARRKPAARRGPASEESGGGEAEENGRRTTVAQRRRISTSLCVRLERHARR